MSTNIRSEDLNSEDKKNTIGHYLLGKSIGEGTFGKVKLGTHILTGEKVAIKILEKNRITEVADVERVAREIHILKLIRHPNIIQLYEIIETSEQLFLIMEYASGGELFEYIVANDRIKEKEACKLFQQIISGVEYLHKLYIVHRDLKPENLLLDHNKNIKIVDFGLSNTYKSGDLLKTACGSPCYAAPEMIAGKRYVPIKVDIWSCGIILFAMTCGYLPFEDASTSNLYKKIMAGEFSIPKFISTEGKDLLKCILVTDPSRRFTANEIRSHFWFNQTKIDKDFEGIFIGVNPIPVEEKILRQMELYGFDILNVRKQLENNKHNHITTTYYLLHQRYLRDGGKPQLVSEMNLISEKKYQEKMSFGLDSPVSKRETGPASHKTEQSRRYEEKEYTKILQEKRESTGGSSSIDKDMGIAGHTTVYTSFHVEDLAQNVELVKSVRNGERPAPLLNNLFDFYIPPKTALTTPINYREAEKRHHSSVQANNENYKVQYTPVVQYNFANSLKPKEVLSSSVASEKETSEPLKQNIRISNINQMEKAKDPSAVMSQTPKEANFMSINLNYTSSTPSRKESKNDATVECTQVVKKSIKLRPRNEFDPLATISYITPRQKLNSRHEKTQASRNGANPHSERICTEGNIHRGAREETLLEFLETDPNLSKKLRLVSPSHVNRVSHTRTSVSPAPESGSVNSTKPSARLNQKNLQFVLETKTPKRFVGDDESSLNKSGRESFSNSRFIKKAVVSPRVTTATSPYPRQLNQKDSSLLYSTTVVTQPSTATTYMYNSTTNPSSNNVSEILKQKKEKDHKSKQQTRAASPTGPPTVYKGPFHVSSVSSKSPKYIMNEINRALDGLKIYFKIMNPYSLRCERDGIKFEVEVHSLYHYDMHYLIKFTKLSGDTAHYNELCSIIYKIIDI